MIALIAAAFVVLIGMVGLGVDIGFVTMNQRAMRNASDSAAIAGALKVVDNEAAVESSVTNMAARNSLPTGATTSCSYVNQSDAVVQSTCAGTAPSTTSGVKATSTYTRSTFFMGLLGTPTMTANAEAIARIFNESTYHAGSSLFIVCGYGTDTVAGGNMNLLAGTSPGSPPYSVNTAAIGTNFKIHGPQVEDCGAGNSMKGLLGTNAYATLPANLAWSSGTHAGPTRRAVYAVDGCAYNIDPDNCVMLIPVAVSASGGNMYAVTWLPFRVTTAGANQHTGVLLGGSYVVQHDPNSGSTTWVKGSNTGPVSVRVVS